jgi:hypothetical protein
VDEVLRRAVAAGVKHVTRPVDEEIFGRRTCRLVDPFGVVWVVSTRVDSHTPTEMQKGFDRRVRALRPLPPTRFEDA